MSPLAILGIYTALVLALGILLGFGWAARMVDRW